MDNSLLLFEAMRNDDSLTFENLIQTLTDVEARDSEGFTLLHRAAQCKRAMFAKHLLLKGADVMSRARWNWTPLHEAANKGNVRTVEILIEYGAKLDAFSDWAETPLILALQARRVPVVSTLLDRGANHLQKNSRGKNPLHVLTMSLPGALCDNILLRKFLEKGVRVESCYRGLTPLQYAVKNQKFDMVKMLLSFGAKTDVYDHDGLAPLHKAVLLQDYNLVSLLLKNNANVNILTKNENYCTPLNEALKIQSKEIYDLLLKFGGN